MSNLFVPANPAQLTDSQLAASIARYRRSVQVLGLYEQPSFRALGEQVRRALHDLEAEALRRGLAGGPLQPRSRPSSAC